MKWYMDQDGGRRAAARLVLFNAIVEVKAGKTFFNADLDVVGEAFFAALFPAGLPDVGELESLRASRADLNRIASAQEGEIKKLNAALGDALGKLAARGAPIPARLTCPSCAALHVDSGAFAEKPHHTHACQSCGNVWRPAIPNTVGVRFLPGFKDEGESS